MQREEGLERLRALGFAEVDAEELWGHFDGAERRGKPSHGHARIPWLEGLEGYDPGVEPELLEDEEGFQRWHGRDAIGYLVLARVVRAQLERPPAQARLVVCEGTFPTGMLGHYLRRLADGGLVGLLTTTSPRRLGHPYAGSARGEAAAARRRDRAPDGAPGGGPKLASTAPLAIGIPSSGGDPVVVDVSMAAVTWGDVVAGLAKEEDVVPFGGEQAHKAFALAVGLHLFVDALVREEGHAAVLLVARPESDPVPALRELAAGARLPGDPK